MPPSSTACVCSSLPVTMFPSVRSTGSWGGVRVVRVVRWGSTHHNSVLLVCQQWDQDGDHSGLDHNLHNRVSAWLVRNLHKQIALVSENLFVVHVLEAAN